VGKIGAGINEKKKERRGGWFADCHPGQQGKGESTKKGGAGPLIKWSGKNFCNQRLRAKEDSSLRLPWPKKKIHHVSALQKGKPNLLNQGEKGGVKKRAMKKKVVFTEMRKKELKEEL